jgi:hypothetical protein
MEKIITDNTKYLVTKLVHVHQQKYIDHILSMYQVFPVCFGGPYAISRGGSRGEGTHPAPPPPTIRKNMIFWRKIVIFHTKYPKNVRPSLRSAQFL